MSLNNIPQRKLNDEIQALTKACPNCLNKVSNSDGLCKECSIKIIARNRWYDANIPVEFWNLKMEDFKGPNELKKAYEAMVGDIQKFYSSGMTVCFAGTHGIGKTMVVSNILKFSCLKNYSTCYTTFADMISSLIDAPFDEKYDARKKLTMSDFLVIDEMDGRHIGTGNAADLYGRTLDAIMRTRMQNKLPSILISNSPNPIETFDGAIKDSIGSLMSKVKMVIVRGNDYRKATK